MCIHKETKEMSDVFISEKPYVSDGLKLMIRKSVVDENSLDRLKAIAEERKLKISFDLDKDFLIIYKP